MPIEAHPKKGYCLPAQCDLLSEEIMTHSCHLHTLGTQWHILKEVDSTNTYCKTLAQAGAPHGTVVIAESQTGGRGRLGRTFCSPAGSGLYCSVILRPQWNLDAIQLVTACTAVAVANAVDALAGCHTAIKWVNDLFLGGRKFCGILTEASFGCEAGQLDYLVVGIGMNLRNIRNALPEELHPIVTSVEEETGCVLRRSAMAGAMLEQMEVAYASLPERTFLDAYRSRSNLIGKSVTVHAPTGVYEARVVGIDADAALIVALPDGTQQTLHTGEVSVRTHNV
jgi:BirA family biotin operon repressor/biotin-[acetyl-CoA-carboxylase] ligase